MTSEKRPSLSAPSKLVFARIDRSMPFDAEALAELERRKIIIRVKDRPLLRSAFNRRGYSPAQYRDIWAIPFRKPLDIDAYMRSLGARGRPRDFHGRSIHTLDLPGRQFVFKGTGASHLLRSFGFGRGEEIEERQFIGGARAPTIRNVVDVLAKLERTHARLKRQKDAFLQWAGRHGVTELPVIKHVAVFRPLQEIAGRAERTMPILSYPRFPKEVNRFAISRKLFETDFLGKFYGEERVHVYSARNPVRLEENKARFKAALKEEFGEKKVSKRDLLRRLIVRGLVLLYTARAGKITLSTENGSVFSQFNVGPHEFFDFDTGWSWHSLSAHEPRESEFRDINGFKTTLLRFRGKRVSEFNDYNLLQTLHRILNIANKRGVSKRLRSSLLAGHLTLVLKMLEPL